MEILKFIAFAIMPLSIVILAVMTLFFSENSEDLNNKRLERDELPELLKVPSEQSSFLGWEMELNTPIYFPDKVRSRHVHIMGATGSGKTESVLLNLIGQDIGRGIPVVIIDAKGDNAFLEFLKDKLGNSNKLKLFDSSDSRKSLPYNPLKSGTSTEAVLRLFNSMTWSEEFYKTRARDTLLKLAAHFSSEKQKLSLAWLNEMLSSPESLTQAIKNESTPSRGISMAEFTQLAGLFSQVQQLCHGELGSLISNDVSESCIDLKSDIENACVVYFKLPALIDPTTTATVGKLIIADLAFYAAKIQTSGRVAPFCPVFIDEFGSLACHSFLELIAKARSAGLALHFSHQSLGDLQAASTTFATQINDNSSTKIVMRIYDPDTADIMARTFGNKETKKETRQVMTNAIGGNEETGAMSVREVKEFRADPDLIKSLPTGCAFVLMNHALRVDGKSSDVFRLRFPALGSH